MALVGEAIAAKGGNLGLRALGCRCSTALCAFRTFLGMAKRGAEIHLSARFDGGIVDTLLRGLRSRERARTQST